MKSSSSVDLHQKNKRNIIKRDTKTVKKWPDGDEKKKLRKKDLTVTRGSKCSSWLDPQKYKANIWYLS